MGKDDIDNMHKANKANMDIRLIWIIELEIGDIWSDREFRQCQSQWWLFISLIIHIIHIIYFHPSLNL